MIVINKIRKLLKWRRENSSKTIGFVPTMGDLHEGHISLVRRSRTENDITVMSIFVNPKQFDRKKDFTRYRRNAKFDIKKAKSERVDMVFMPLAGDIYPPGYETYVSVENITGGLCGRYRPGHFRGVATVVLKLLNLVRPDRVYFGRKDYQQYKVIEKMCRDLNLGMKVTGCPTAREQDGLAMSSRNSRLNSRERVRAAGILRSLQAVGDLLESKKRVDITRAARLFRRELRLAGKDKVEYIEFVHPETLEPVKTLKLPVLAACAVWIGGTRLIDNILLD